MAFGGDMGQLWHPSSLPKGLLATSHPKGRVFLVCPAQPGFDAPPCPALCAWACRRMQQLSNSLAAFRILPVGAGGGDGAVCHGSPVILVKLGKCKSD